MNVEICWIFILKDSEKETLRVDYCSDDLLDNYLERHNEWMLYYRRFDNIMDAIAHKKYLSELSRNSILSVINQMNPHNCNLQPIMKQMI